jgi:hypothetical protein
VIIEGKIPGLRIQGESTKCSPQPKEFEEEFFRMPAFGKEKVAEGTQAGVDGMQKPELSNLLR